MTAYLANSIAQTTHRQRQHAVAYCREPRLFSQSLTAQKIFAISSSRDKNSCHNFARLSAWCWRASTQADKRTLIQSVLIHGMCNLKDGTRAALLKCRLGYGNRPRMSFRGAKRRGNPLNRNENTVAIATDLACFRNYYRATTLHSQKERDKTQTTTPCECLLGGCAFGASG